MSAISGFPASLTVKYTLAMGEKLHISHLTTERNLHMITKSLPETS
jgi:hypothetical protein